MPNPFQAIADQLHQLGGDQMRGIQRKALKKVGTMVQDAIQANCPVKTDTTGGLLEPGELKASIKARVHLASDSAILEGDTSRVVIGPVGHTETVVANWVENGHVARNGKSSAGTKKFVPAHPFVRWAWDQTHDAAEAAYTESVTADVAEAMK